MQVWLSVTEDVHERHGEHAFSFRFSFDVSDPPLLVLFSCNYNHLSLNKRQLVVIVGLAVVDRLHPAGFILTRIDLPWEGHRSFHGPWWSPISVLSSLL